MTPYKEMKLMAEASESNRLDVQAKLDRVTAERNALQEMLNQLEEQNHSLEQRRYAEQQAREAAERRVEEPASGTVVADVSEPPIYKPGLYAVRHIDNWDGERDTVLTFAMLDADGKWTDKETGDALLTYRGDKILKAWPLDCSDAPGSQVIGVPRNWLEDWALELVEAAQDGGQMSNQVEHLLEIHPKP